MIQIKKTILTLVALLAVTTGAWAETGENIFQYCYDCQRSPAYPKTTASASLSGFANPLVGYKGSGFSVDNTSAGPWKLEYMGIWSTTDKHGIDDYSVSNYQSTYNCTDVPVFRLYQWNATANEYQHAAYGVVCAYAKVSNAVEHTALFVAQGGWGCVLTNSSHSSSMNITFDEDLSTGLTTLIAAATPNASSASTVDVAWDKATKTGTFDMPGGNVELEPEYYPQAALTAQPTAINDVPATTDGAIVNAGTVANIGETTNAQGTVMYYVSQTALDDAALLALAADAWTADVPTAQSFTAAGTAHVYYYVRGNDGDTDDEIFSDGDILATNALTVTIAAAPTYAVTFADDLAEPDKWTASPATDVTKGDKVTVTYSGTKKVLGVKAEKKAAAVPKAAKDATAEDVGKLIGADGNIYDDAGAATAANTTAVAMIAYVGSDNGEDAPYNHGLALAMSDATSGNSYSCTWKTSKTDAGHTKQTSSTFTVESGLQYNDATHNSDTYPPFKAAIANNGTAAPTGCSAWFLASGYQWKQMIGAAGLSNLGLMSGAYYWSSSENDASRAWFFDYNNGNWYNSSKDLPARVRACLAF